MLNFHNICYSDHLQDNLRKRLDYLYHCIYDSLNFKLKSGINSVFDLDTVKKGYSLNLLQRPPRYFPERKKQTDRDELNNSVVEALESTLHTIMRTRPFPEDRLM